MITIFTTFFLFNRVNTLAYIGAFGLCERCFLRSLLSWDHSDFSLLIQNIGWKNCTSSAERSVFGLDFRISPKLTVPSPLKIGRLTTPPIGWQPFFIDFVYSASVTKSLTSDFGRDISGILINTSRTCPVRPYQKEANLGWSSHFFEVLCSNISPKNIKNPKT